MRSAFNKQQIMEKINENEYVLVLDVDATIYNDIYEQNSHLSYEGRLKACIEPFLKHTEKTISDAKNKGITISRITIMIASLRFKHAELDNHKALSGQGKIREDYRNILNIFKEKFRDTVKTVEFDDSIIELGELLSEDEKSTYEKSFQFLETLFSDHKFDSIYAIVHYLKSRNQGSIWAELIDDRLSIFFILIETLGVEAHKWAIPEGITLTLSKFNTKSNEIEPRFSVSGSGEIDSDLKNTFKKLLTNYAPPADSDSPRPSGQEVMTAIQNIRGMNPSPILQIPTNTIEPSASVSGSGDRDSNLHMRNVSVPREINSDSQNIFKPSITNQGPPLLTNQAPLVNLDSPRPSQEDIMATIKNIRGMNPSPLLRKLAYVFLLDYDTIFNRKSNEDVNASKEQIIKSNLNPYFEHIRKNYFQHMSEYQKETASIYIIITGTDNVELAEFRNDSKIILTVLKMEFPNCEILYIDDPCQNDKNYNENPDRKFPSVYASIHYMRMICKKGDILVDFFDKFDGDYSCSLLWNTLGNREYQQFIPDGTTLTLYSNFKGIKLLSKVTGSGEPNFNFSKTLEILKGRNLTAATISPDQFKDCVERAKLPIEKVESGPIEEEEEDIFANPELFTPRTF
jgi:hypothetical protein